MIEAIRAGRRSVHGVHLPRSVGTPGTRELEALVTRHSIPTLPPSHSSTDTRSEGVWALAAPFPEEPAEALFQADSPRFLVALDRLTDVGNLGSIARSAEVSGVQGLILEHRHTPPISPGALRASAGALEHLRIGRAPNLKRVLELGRGEGMVVAVAQPGGASWPQLQPEQLAGDLIWVFGSEDRGVRKGILALADLIVGIPVEGRIGSLGVAAAAAYLLVRTAELRAG